MDTKHWDKLGSPSDVSFDDLEAAHIIPFAYASWNDRPVCPWNLPFLKLFIKARMLI